jgi:alkyl hydroperoxide reductase subunit AhpF
MKKIFSILLVAALCFAFTTVSNTAHAQVYKTRTLAAGDTASNATTIYLTKAAIEDGIVCIQAKVTKISGTVAGTVWLQGSVDGTNFETISTDTLALANQTTNFKTWPLTGTKYYSYRIKVTTSGTQASVATLSWLRRHEF